MNLIYPKIGYSERAGLKGAPSTMTRSVFSEGYAGLLEALIEARQAAGITQAELAQRLGRPQPFVSYVERGERRIDVIEFCVLARALGADPRVLFDEVLAKIPRDARL